MKNLIILLLTVFLISSCGKKNEEVKTVNKDTKENSQMQSQKNETQTQTTNETSASNGIFPISSVSKDAKKNQVPEFSWTENGKPVSVSDYKGKVMVLNFWATWCGPCKQEMPELSEINKELKDKDFVMLGLTVFKRPGSKSIEEILTQIPVSYKVIDGNDELVKIFEQASGSPVEGVPTTYIIDKKGNIVETFTGTRTKTEFMSAINKYL